MTVARLLEIERIPLAIDYRRMYRANAVLAIGTHETPASPIEFTLEMSPMGSHEVSVRFPSSVDVPLVPAIRLLKDHITHLDRDGQLP